MMQWWREPLVHFVVLGGILFAVAGARTQKAETKTTPPAISTADSNPIDTRVTVTAQTQAALVLAHKTKTGNVPNEQETKALIDDWIEQEILYREALRLGLDRDDLIVRRRLIQKMRFVLEGLKPVPAPDEAAVSAYINAHPELFTKPPRLSFEHRFYSDTMGVDAQNLAIQAVTALNQNQPPPPPKTFAHGERFENTSTQRVNELMGEGFVIKLQAQPQGVWSGPIRSSFGWHAVKLISVQAVTTPQTAAENQARRHLTEAAAAQFSKDAVQSLRANYSITIEAP